MHQALCAAAIALLTLAADVVAGDAITIQMRSRAEDANGAWSIRQTSEAWQAQETAVIVCDMWDSHHSLNAVRRVVEMAPRMNAVLENARNRGVLIVHSPSGCMAAYENHPGRTLAQRASTADNLPADISEWCRVIPAEERGTYPIDQVSGSEDDDPSELAVWHDKLTARGRDPGKPWKRQNALLSIEERDAISDSGVEIWNLFETRGIKNVILLGVHTNMCVLGRPFGLRQMAKNGKNVVLMRDMTDTMYDPSKWPYVNHFTGTRLIVEHIEKFVCPTITSVDFLGGEPFRFARDRRKIAMLIGDDEYQTAETLPAFAAWDLEPLGFEVTIVHADERDPNRFPGMAEAVRAADLVLVSARRRLPPRSELDALRQHVAAGKPVVGIRTASHAWCQRDPKQNRAAAAEGRGVWPEFDADVLGGNYTNHYGVGPKAAIIAAVSADGHPILRGVDPPALVGHGSLYRVQPLASTAAALLLGSISDQEPEPVAWTNMAGPKQARVFYTSLGHPDDFRDAGFRKLLANGIFWALDDPYPTGQRIDELLPARVR